MSINIKGVTTKGIVERIKNLRHVKSFKHYTKEIHIEEEKSSGIFKASIVYTSGNEHFFNYREETNTRKDFIFTKTALERKFLQNVYFELLNEGE